MIQPSSSPSTWMRACSRTRQQRLRAGVLEPRCQGHLQDSQGAPRGGAALSELHPCPRGDVGHEREVIVRPPASAADDVPATDGAVLRRLGVRGRRWRVSFRQRRVRHREEGRLDHAVIGPVARGPERLRLPVATPQSHVHPFRVDALDGLQELVVHADLEQGRGLDLVRQLGVRDLVRPAQRRLRIIDAEQEVREAEPGPIEEAGLEDDVIAAQDGGARIRCLAAVELDAGLPFRPLLVQVGDTRGPSHAGHRGRHARGPCRAPR